LIKKKYFFLSIQYTTIKIMKGFLLIAALVVIYFLGKKYYSPPESTADTPAVIAAATVADQTESNSLNSGNSITQSTNNAAAAAADTYKFYQGISSTGFDIVNSGLANNTTALKEWCTNEEKCKGFNTNGWMKYYIQPLEKWRRFAPDTPGNANMGFYTKD
jgi:hypothetical protein